MKRYLIALDAGTTSVRAFCYDPVRGEFFYRARREISCRYPHPGWVEQDAEEIAARCEEVLSDCIRAAGEEGLAGIGITNQRETVILFDSERGRAIAPAIGWQCRRTADYCASIPREDADAIRRKTGLLPDAYFSASKIKWAIEHLDEVRTCLEKGTLRAGTVDSFLIYRLTGNFATDYTNASRTMLFDLASLDWDEELLAYFGIPRSILPVARPSDAVMGNFRLGEREVPVTGVLGDQQAALFGQACLKEGDAKITYGTGLFMLTMTGERPVFSEEGLLTTVANSFGGKTYYALEGSVFHAGSSIKWLRDEMGLLSDAAESEGLASSVKDTGGVYFVPAFTGLGAPYWDPDARALLMGVSRGTRREHVVRAVLESIAYGARDLAECMKKSGIVLRSVRCDGGASANRFLMQFQADLLGIPVDRPKELESTAFGAANLCAVSLGMTEVSSFPTLRKSEKIFRPSAERAYFDGLYEGYLSAVRRALSK